MVAPTILPGRAYQGVNRVSDLLFGWRASDLSIDAYTGQSGTFARSSVGGLVQGTGLDHALDTDNQLRLVGPASDGVPRWEWVQDENSLWVPALRLEGARTNHMTRSQQFDSWMASNTVVTANAGAAPDGKQTADRVTDDSTSGAHYVSRGVTGLGAGANIVLSCYVKSEDHQWVWLGESAGAWNRQTYDLTNGVVGSSSTNVTDAGIEDAGNGWYRCWFAMTGAAASSTCRLYLSGGDNFEYAHSGSGTSILAWGFQVDETATFRSTYVPTEAAAVTRAAESLSWPFNAVPQPMTVYCKFVEGGSIDTNNATLASIGNADAADPRLYIQASATNNYSVVYDPGASNSISTISGPTAGQVTELRATVSAAGAAQIFQALDGAAETSATAGTAREITSSPWSALRTHMGSLDGTSQSFQSWLAYKIAPGVRSLSYMREAY